MTVKQGTYNELMKTGRKTEIVEFPITHIKLFKDGDMFWVKAKVKGQGRGQGLFATLEKTKVTVDFGLLKEE